MLLLEVLVRCQAREPKFLSGTKVVALAASAVGMEPLTPPEDKICSSTPKAERAPYKAGLVGGSYPPSSTEYWTVAQWLERSPDKQEVVGSTPTGPTNLPVAERQTHR